MNSDNYFRESPFALMASPETAACWSGRPPTLERIARLQSSLLTRADSSLDVIWANFGAGKSHALYHLMHRIASAASGQKGIITVYVEMPEQIRRFVDLYSRLVDALPLSQIADCLSSVAPRKLPDDLRRWATAFCNGGPEERVLAEQWITAGRPSLRDLKNAIGIASRIEDDVAACDILSAIVTAVAASNQRVLILLDEFQRVGRIQPAGKRAAILSNLRSVFSRNPRYFSIVAAVTSRMEHTALELFPKELRSLVGMKPAVALPEFSREEALEFVYGRFRFFRPSGYNADPAAPFGKRALEAIVNELGQGDATRLIPRTMLQALSWIYDSRTDGQAQISVESAKRLLGELRWESAGDAHG